MLSLPRGNATSIPKPIDLENSYACTYDAWNRLAFVWVDANSNGDHDEEETVIARYEYDGLGRRVKKHLNTDTDDDFDEFRHFYYNSGWQVLETRKSTSENTPPRMLQPEVQYVWSLRYIDAAVRRDENTDADDLCDDETLYYLTDANSNVTCLTDTGGDAVERYVYDPYGKVTILNGASGVDKDGAVTEWTEDTDQTASDVDNTILYCGYYHDWETGLYHVRNRTFHPTLGRWMQRDPTGYPDGMSVYEYVKSGPTVAFDPLGLQWEMNPDRYRSGSSPSEEQQQSKVKLHVKRTKGGTHGSVEFYGPKGERWNVFMDPDEESLWTRFWSRYWPPEPEAYIQVAENKGDTWWWASLYVRVTPVSGWRPQISATYSWDIKVENICCLSNRVRVRSVGCGPETTHAALESKTHDVPMGSGPKYIDKASLGVGQPDAHPPGTYQRQGKSLSLSTGVIVLIDCEE